LASVGHVLLGHLAGDLLGTAADIHERLPRPREEAVDTFRRLDTGVPRAELQRAAAR
jgi:hypothetical protein